MDPLSQYLQAVRVFTQPHRLLRAPRAALRVRIHVKLQRIGNRACSEEIGYVLKPRRRRNFRAAKASFVYHCMFVHVEHIQTTQTRREALVAESLARGREVKASAVFRLSKQPQTSPRNLDWESIRLPATRLSITKQPQRHE